MALIVAVTAVLGGAFTPLQRTAVGVGFTLVWVLSIGRLRPRPDGSEIAALGVIAWGAVSAVLSGTAPLAAKETLVAWLVAFALWAVSRRSPASGGALGARMLVVAAAFVAAAAVVEMIATGSLRVGGVFENPNVAASMLVAALPLGLASFADRPGRRSAWVMLLVLAVVATGSRAGLLAVVVVVWVLLPPGRVRWVGVLGGAVLAAGAVAWRFATQPDLLAWHRVSIWRGVISIWSSRPILGVGPGSLVEAAGPERILHPDQVGRYQFVIGYAESTPLAVLVQVGLIGVLLACLAIGWWWVESGRRALRESVHLRACVAAVLVMALFHDFLTVEPVLWWWAVVLGLIESSVRPNRPTRDRVGTTGPAVAAGLALAWLTAWGIVTPSLARWWVPSGPEISTEQVERSFRLEPWYPVPASHRVRLLLGNPELWSPETSAEALHWARRAVAVHPGLARLWTDLGRVYIRVLVDLGGTRHDVAAARAAFRRAVELDPRLPWHWLEWARLERVLGNREDAIRLTRRALDEEPNTVRAWLMLSRLELERGRVGAARVALSEAVDRADEITRPNLTDYERELLAMPPGQLAALRRDLGEDAPRR